MRKIIFGLILGIFLISILSINAVMGEDNETNNQTNSNQTNTCSPACDSDEICLNSTCVDNDSDENETEDEDDNETKNGKVVTVNKTRISKENLTFTPWQKRNESECLEGCSCHGAVMSCETETGKVMTIQAGRSGNIIIITIEGTEVETELEVETESDGENNTEINAKMSNGQKKQIKIMPNTASEKALKKLKLKNCVEEKGCTIELKEVGSGKDKQLAYEIQAERHFRILALFQVKAQEKAQVNAETGAITVVKKPWWAFLATEPEE